MIETTDKILAEAKKRFAKAQSWEAEARVRYRDDLKFGTADSVNGYQWPQQIMNSRMQEEKPCLTMNRTFQYCMNIINNARQNKADIQIRPVGNGATFKAAQVIEAIIRHIEYISDAQQAYDNATWHQVFGGIGYWRVRPDYKDSDSLDQEIYIERIQDPQTVYLDPSIAKFDGSDARWCIIFKDMERSEFDAQYPEYKDQVGSNALGDTDHHEVVWMSQDKIRVAEYYRIVTTDDWLHVLADGSTVKRSDVRNADRAKRKVDPEHASQLDELDRHTIAKRKVTDKALEWYLIAGDTVIDQRDVPGKYIPVVRVIGQEIVIDGRLDRKGHVRALVDAQRSYNYYTSAGIEYVALQSKTPWLAPVAAIEGYETEWANANNTNLAVLPFNHMDDAGNEIPAPSQKEPPTFAPAYQQGMQVSIQEMEMASGQPAATFGEPSNERSGKAINERQRAAETSTYHFVDHLASAIQYTGKILLDLIPHIYDTQRVMRIIQPDGTLQTIQIDPNAPQAHAPMQPIDEAEQADPQFVSLVLNPSIGEYDVVAQPGPDYGSQRQEAFNALTQILSQNESLAPIVGDLMFRNAAFPGATLIADRLMRMVPPQALGNGPSPQEQQLQQQLAAQHGVMMQMSQEIDSLKNKQMLAEMNREIDFYKAESERLRVVSQADPQALMPVIRNMVSQVMQDDVQRLIHNHMMANAASIQAAQNPMTQADPMHGMPQPPAGGMPPPAPQAPTQTPQG